MTELLENIETEKWTNVQVDSQVLTSFMECPRKYDYVFNRHLVPVLGVSKSIQKGQLSHVGIHAYWKARLEGKDYQEASVNGVDAAKKEIVKFNNLGPDDSLDVLHNLIAFFKFQTTKSWIPRFTEQHFRILGYEDPALRLRIFLTGRIDLGLSNPQLPLIPVDVKSEAERWFYSAMRNQFKIYAIACKTFIFGVQRFGFQKTVPEEQKFKLEIISFDNDILEEFKNETVPYYIKRMLIANEDKFYPMNTASCIHGHFACPFSDKYNQGGICAVSRELREQKLQRYFTVGEPWNPEEF